MFISACELFDPKKILFYHDTIQDSHENFKYEVLFVEFSLLPVNVRTLFQQDM